MALETPQASIRPGDGHARSPRVQQEGIVTADAKRSKDSCCPHGNTLEFRPATV